MDYKQVESALDALGEEIEQITVTLSGEFVDLRAVRMGLDRLEAIRSNVHYLRSKLNRKYTDAKWVYEDGFRTEAERGSRNQRQNTAIDERRAVYETKNLTYLQELRKWERALSEASEFRKHIDSKIRWLDSKRFQLFDEEKREQYMSNKEIASRD